jgi:UMF1 family MFS transporter
MTGSPRRTIVSWCLYDFANSAYAAIIPATIFSTYYTQVIVGNQNGLGDRWWGRVVSVSMLFVALSSPYLGGVADSGGIRKRLWILYTWTTILAVMAFVFLEPGMILAGFLLATLANIGQEGSQVFYNSYLPEIAPPDHQGRVSGWGFAVGYAGSITALMAARPFTDPFRPSTIWLLVALQFGLFSLPGFLFLPPDRGSSLGLLEAARQGYRVSRAVLGELWRNRSARYFLLAYMFYEDGVNTVISFASIFAAQTLRFQPSELVLIFLVVQFSALAGAAGMARPTDTKGPKWVVVRSLLLWCAAVTIAYFVQTKMQFWAVTVIAGLGLGSVQAASRAFYARFIPAGGESRYFGIYAMVGKTAAIMGPILFGEMSTAFGSQRPAILSVAALFLIGLALLSKVRVGGPGAVGPD